MASATAHATPSDVVVIAVMGMTGAGKSTFIQKASGLKDVVVGHGLESTTEVPKLHEFAYKSKRMMLIDTPGFDDTHRSDADVLLDVATFLSGTYASGLKVTGIIYLHDITKNRMTHGGLENLVMFQHLCGEEPLENVVLATTHWSNDANARQNAERLEKDLVEKPEYWGNMIKNNAKLAKFENTRHSALKIIDGLMKKETVTLAIQDEMVHQGLAVSETAAGSCLSEDMVKLHQELEVKLEKQVAQIQVQHNEALKQYQRQQAEKTEKVIERLKGQQERLRVDDRDRRRLFEMNMDQMNKKRVEQEKASIARLSTEIKVLESAAAAEGETANTPLIKWELEQKKAKKEQTQKWVELATATMTTGIAAGVSVVNPTAIPVAVVGGLDIVKAINNFFRKKK